MYQKYFCTTGPKLRELFGLVESLSVLILQIIRLCTSNPLFHSSRGACTPSNVHGVFCAPLTAAKKWSSSAKLCVCHVQNVHSCKTGNVSGRWKAPRREKREFPPPPGSCPAQSIGGSDYDRSLGSRSAGWTNSWETKTVSGAGEGIIGFPCKCVSERWGGTLRQSTAIKICRRVGGAVWDNGEMGGLAQHQWFCLYLIFPRIFRFFLLRSEEALETF